MCFFIFIQKRRFLLYADFIISKVVAKIKKTANFTPLHELLYLQQKVGREWARIAHLVFNQSDWI
jgi:hypothetical protein